MQRDLVAVRVEWIHCHCCVELISLTVSTVRVVCGYIAYRFGSGQFVCYVALTYSPENYAFPVPLIFNPYPANVENWASS
jgi:hypothetical protein